MLVEFSLKLVYSTMCGKKFQSHGVHIPRNCIESTYFYSCLFPLPTQNLPQSSYHHTLRGEKLLIPPGSILFKNLFLPTKERGGGNYDLHY